MASWNTEDFNFKGVENVDTETILLGFAKFCKVDVTMEMHDGSAKDVLSDGEYEKAENVQGSQTLWSQ